MSFVIFSFSDPINKTVNDSLLNGVRSTDPETPTNTIKGMLYISIVFCQNTVHI